MQYLIHRGEKIPLIGFGTYRLGMSEKAAEIETIRYGMDRLGMTLLDTAEMYGSGLSEEILGECIRSYDRSSLFIVDKILPSNAHKGQYLECCRQSLRRLGTDYIDLYLLHWKGPVDLQDMADNMQKLVEQGLIRHWGVSNFDTHEMQQLFACKNGQNCFCDQILYNICERGAEYDLIPWCKQHGVLVMGYSPLCNCREARTNVTSDRLIISSAQARGQTPESLMLSFVVRNKDIITVFKTSDISHLTNNMQNVFAPFSEAEMSVLCTKFKPPAKKYPLEKI